MHPTAAVAVGAVAGVNDEEEDEEEEDEDEEEAAAGRLKLCSGGLMVGAGVFGPSGKSAS